MKQRNLRLVPAALLMTTALSWSLPSLAQTSAGSSTAPARPASAAAPSMGGGSGLHPNAQVAPPGPAVGGTAAPAPTGTPPGASTNGLPPALSRRYPATPAAAAPHRAAPPPPAPSRPPPRAPDAVKT